MRGAVLPPTAREMVGESKKAQAGEPVLTTVEQGAPAAPSLTPADPPNLMPNPAIPNPDCREQQFDEDFLDCLDNARRTTMEMRKTDFLMVAFFFILSLLLAAIVLAAIFFWRRTFHPS